jgi:hypothetical protein
VEEKHCTRVFVEVVETKVNLNRKIDEKVETLMDFNRTQLLTI